MRCASGASYAIAFRMALLSLVWLTQVPARTPATDVASSSPSPSPASPPPPSSPTPPSSSSSLTTPPAEPTQHSKSSSSPPSKSAQSSDTARGPLPSASGNGEGAKSSPPLRTPPPRTAMTTTPGPRSVFTTGGQTVADRAGTGKGLVYHGSSRSPEAGETHLQVSSSAPANVCDSRCNDVMARKQGICGCNSKMAGKPVVKSGLRRSALHRPVLK